MARAPDGPARRERSRRRARSDSGAATTELVIAAPALLLVIMVVIQAALYFHAVGVASAAAQSGARAATEEGATVADGESEARDFVSRVAPNLLTGVEVGAGPVDGGQAVQVTVNAEVEQVLELPGLDMSVHETAERVVERFRPASEEAPEDVP